MDDDSHPGIVLKKSEEVNETSHKMFLRLFLLAAIVPAVYLWCTPFISCNQTIYGDFSDIEKGMKVILLGRPFQKFDEIIITGEYYNNGSEVFDDAQFRIGLSKGLIMHQLGDDLEKYLMTASVGASEPMMNITGMIAGRGKNEFGADKTPKPNITCDDPFVLRLKSIDGYGFALGTMDEFPGNVKTQYPKADRAQAVFFSGQLKTTKIEFKCLDDG
ncbi:hypothetical protein B9Z55_005409 [Caenorhabditis nigoni]|uniref:Uncharacterized protein n=1 Tax=Caenorhabditis nigoni TaxID=1611254 RepID=A0A2G5V0R5_9PELO|nr:hypothetical protein B9Z55_005409 [Caenorhabditis nigoni]